MRPSNSNVFEAGWEEVDVPTGAIRVERAKVMNGVRGQTTHWYAPNLGCIKWSSGDRSRVLKSDSRDK
jgi:hypothetical protein